MVITDDGRTELVSRVTRTVSTYGRILTEKRSKLALLGSFSAKSAIMATLPCCTFLFFSIKLSKCSTLYRAAPPRTDDVPRMRALIACVALAALMLRCSAELVNAEVAREVDIRSNVEVETSVVTMRNDGANAEASFVLALPAERGEVGTLIVAEGTGIKKDGSRTLALVPVDERQYRVKFANPLEPGARTTVTVLVDYMSTLRPMPAAIRAGEQQHIAYAGDAYWYSPYATEACRTVVALPSARATSVGELPKPHKTGSYQLVLGPYAFGPKASYAYTMRALNNRGFLVAKRATLWYHVSHWGRVAVREEFVLQNAAAALEGEWSRADYDRNAGKVDPTSHGDVWANLPPDATDVVYEGK